MRTAPLASALACSGLLAAALVLSSCSKPDSFALLNPDSLDFGEVIVGESAEDQLEICNVGDRDLAFALSVSPPFFFAELADETSLIVAEGECDKVAVSFQPDATGAQDGLIPLSFTDERNRVTGGIDIPVAGTGIEAEDEDTDSETDEGTDTDTGDGGTDTDDTTDTGGTDTSDTGSTDTGDTDPPKTNPCPDYSGVNHLGHVRTYITTDLYDTTYGASGTYTTWTESIDAKGQALVWTDALYTTRTGGELSQLTAYLYTCDDSGLSLQSYIVDGAYNSTGTSFKEREEHTYTDSHLLMVHDFAVSGSFEDTWASDIEYWSSLTGKSSDFDLGSIAAVATGEGTTSVPAGSFDTLTVEITDNSNETDTQHLDPDLGLIASDYFELQSYE